MKTHHLGLRTILLGSVALSLMAVPALTQTSPQRDRKAFFGETHVHTGWSFAAYII
jgi:hypothetical protein